jgi:thymidine kinase
MGGYLYLIFGPMFSGKSTKLIKLINKFKINNTKTLVIKHSLDNRYNNLNFICSHNYIKEPCSITTNLLEYLDNTEYISSQIIIIDEAQFFSDDLIIFCKQAIDIDNKYVIVAGLISDYKKEKFGKILDLIPIADKIEKLEGICEYCEKKSIFTQKIINNEIKIEIGNDEIYKPVCRKHYKLLN